jgi:chaperonin GroES
MKVRPLHDRVLVQTCGKRCKDGGRNHQTPDNAKEKPQEGKVVAVGPGRIRTNRASGSSRKSRRGTAILFGRYGGTEVKIDGEEYLIMGEEDILGIIE